MKSWPAGHVFELCVLTGVVLLALRGDKGPCARAPASRTRAVEQAARVVAKPTAEAHAAGVTWPGTCMLQTTSSLPPPPFLGHACRYELHIERIQLLAWYGGAVHITPQDYFALEP